MASGNKYVVPLPDKERKSLGLDGAEEIVQRAYDCLEQARMAERDWRTLAQKTYRFYAGDQWDADVKSRLEALNKPIITRNLVGIAVDTLTGVEVTNKQRIVVEPRQMDPGAPANNLSHVATEIIRYFIQQCDGDVELSDIFKDAAICGRGAAECRTDYESDPDGTVIIERCHPLEFYVDPRSKKRNLADARWIVRLKELDKSEAKEMWPDFSEQIDAAMSTNADANAGIVPVPQEQPETDRYYPAKGYTAPAGTVQIMEYQHRERETYVELVSAVPGPDGQGQKEQITPEQGQVLLKQAQDQNDERVKIAQDLLAQKQAALVKIPITPNSPLQAIQLLEQVDEIPPGTAQSLAPVPLPVIGPQKYKWCHYQCFIIGKTVLEKRKTALDGSAFTYKFITAKRDDSDMRRVTFFGIVKNMLSPQEWANKTISEITHILGVMPKGGIVAETGVFPDIEAAKDEWAAGDTISEINPGKMNAWRPRETGNSLAALNALYQFANLSGSGIRESTGISVELMGQSERDIAGVVVAQRAKQAVITQAEIFNAWKLFLKQIGRYILDLVREYIATDNGERAIMITGRDGAQTIPLLKNQLAIKYDLIVDQAPDSTSYKQEVGELLKQILPALIKAGITPPIQLLRYVLPATVAEEIIRMVQAMPPQAPPGTAPGIQGPPKTSMPGGAPGPGGPPGQAPGQGPPQMSPQTAQQLLALISATQQGG